MFISLVIIIVNIVFLKFANKYDDMLKPNKSKFNVVGGLMCLCSVVIIFSLTTTEFPRYSSLFFIAESHQCRLI